MVALNPNHRQGTRRHYPHHTKHHDLSHQTCEFQTNREHRPSRYHYCRQDNERLQWYFLDKLIVTRFFACPSGAFSLTPLTVQWVKK